MNSLSRTFAALAATTVMAAATVPAIAAEDTTVPTDVSAKASLHRHHRIASIRHTRRVADVTPLQRNLGCSGEWCGRQFVLMIGVGF